MPDRVAILGAGSWGTALATLLPEHEVVLWSRSKEQAAEIAQARENRLYLPGIRLGERVSPTDRLEEALSGAEVVVIAVPSEGLLGAMRLAAPFIAPSALLVNASKGLEESTGRRLSELIALAVREASGEDERLVLDRLAALSGPNLAVEVARGIPTASVAASLNPEAADRCRALFMGPMFRIYTSQDLVGVELAGAMKNVIAIAAGICDGMGFGDNTRSALMTRGLAEISRLGSALGAQAGTFLGLAGVGDLIATAGSRLSRNYRAGYGLGEGKPLGEVLREIGQVAEGVPTTRAMYVLAQRTGVEMPIAEALRMVLFQGASARDKIAELMLRPAKGEAA